jgi:multidrug resistance efflux pump
MFDKMLEEFKSLAEIRDFAESQMKTIQELSKRIVSLEQERDHLKNILETTTDLVQKPKILLFENYNNDEEVIAKQQLAMLKQKSDSVELTLEETKKVAEYAKILSNLREAKPKDNALEVKALSDEELMKMLNEPSQQSTSS